MLVQLPDGSWRRPDEIVEISAYILDSGSVGVSVRFQSGRRQAYKVANWGDAVSIRDGLARRAISASNPAPQIEDLERELLQISGFIDNIDNQISEVLVSVGRFPPEPARFPDRVDAICAAVKEFKDRWDSAVACLIDHMEKGSEQ